MLRLDDSDLRLYESQLAAQFEMALDTLRRTRSQLLGTMLSRQLNAFAEIALMYGADQSGALNVRG